MIYNNIIHVYLHVHVCTGTLKGGNHSGLFIKMVVTTSSKVVTSINLVTILLQPGNNLVTLYKLQCYKTVYSAVYD